MLKTVYPSRLSGQLAAMPSKSMAHRAVVLAALCAGTTRIAPLQLSQDVRATLACARALGLIAEPELAAIDGMPGFVSARITGNPDRRPARGTRVLDCGESGSTLRFFIPLALDGGGSVRFIGHGKLMQRPLAVYEELFRPLGVSWSREGDALTVEGALTPGTYALPGDVSSQFITGLLLALPALPGDSRIVLTTPLESRPYVELTRRAQASFGVVSSWEEGGRALLIPGGQRAVSPGDARVEGDWSHAAFALVAGALGSAPVRLTGLDMDSLQGDRAICAILRAMGADIRREGEALVSYPSKLHASCVDVSQVPDLVPALAVAMASARGESRITGAARLRVKESDRLAAMRAALCAAGADVTELPDGLIIHGGGCDPSEGCDPCGMPLHAAAIDGCNDHRVVMAMAVASALSDGPLTISDAEAVAKSAPAFWEEFESLGGKTR